MRIAVPRILRVVSLVTSVKNRVLNALTAVLSGQRTAIDWTDVKIVHPERISIGDQFGCGRGIWLESVSGQGKLVIGNRVNFSDYVHIGCIDEIVIEDGVLIGSRVLITDHSHGLTGAGLSGDVLINPNDRAIVSKGGVYIGRRVWIGDGACILSGVTVGEGAIIGANAVVTQSVPAGTIWAGVPACQIWPRPPDARTH